MIEADVAAEPVVASLFDAPGVPKLVLPQAIINETPIQTAIRHRRAGLWWPPRAGAERPAIHHQDVWRMFSQVDRKRERARWKLLVKEYPQIETDEWNLIGVVHVADDSISPDASRAPASSSSSSSSSSAPSNIAAIARCKRDASTKRIVVCEFACDSDSALGKAALENNIESERFCLE